MSYNLNIGKLLVASVFSYEVQNYFYQLRGYRCACVTTFGLYGKSIQYDRMKEIKYIGETKGNGTCSIPNDLYQVFGIPLALFLLSKVGNNLDISFKIYIGLIYVQLYFNIKDVNSLKLKM